MKFIPFFILICCFNSTITLSQEIPLLKNYSIEHGLPSNNVFDICKDNLGYIWLATSNGISRFDGYNFENYSFDSGLEELTFTDLVQDSKGDLYTRSKQGNVYRYEDNTFVKVSSSNPESKE